MKTFGLFVQSADTLRTRLGFVRGRWSRRNTWQHLPIYWRARRRTALIRFRVNRVLFSSRRRRREQAGSIAVTRQIARAILRPSLYAAALIVIVTGIQYTTVHYTLAPWIVRTIPIGLTHSIKTWMIIVGSYITPSHALDRSMLVSLLAIIAQVAGVFLGLYFTVLSLLASTSYREVPADLRAVVLEDRASTVYLNIVALTGAAALYLLGLVTLGYQSGRLHIVVMSLLSASSVLSFVVLGVRAISFFDHAIVTNSLAKRVLDAAHDATSAGKLSADLSFQSHFHWEAARALDLLESLVTVTASTSHCSPSLRRISVAAIDTLGVYTGLKAKIAPTSLWFERVLKHPSWLASTNLSSLERAVRLGIGMQPTEHGDLDWLERRLINIMTSVTRILIERGDYRSVVAVTNRAHECSDMLARDFRIEGAKMIHEALMTILPSVAQSAVASSRPDHRAQAAYLLAVIDGIVQGPCRIIPAFGEGVRGVSESSVRALIRTAQAVETADLGISVPTSVLASIQDFRKTLAFERDIEGRRLTPEWATTHYLARAYCKDLVEMFECVLAISVDTYTNAFDVLQGTATVDSAVFAVQRGREAVEKLRFHIGAVTESLERLSVLKCAFGEQTWPTLNVDGIHQRLAELDGQLLSTLASIIPRLSVSPPTGDIPDTFGYACTTLGYEAFQALQAKRGDLFCTLFPPFLTASLSAHDRVRDELRDFPIQTRINVSADVILDLLELSGYAYIDTALFGGSAWMAAQSAWQKVLGTMADRVEFFRLIIAETEIRDNTFILSDRSVLRTAWAQDFQRAMRETGYLGDGFWRSDRDGVRTIPVDPLAAVYLQSCDLSGSARDIFFAAYVSTHPDAQNINMPRSVRDLLIGAGDLLEDRKDAAAVGEDEWDKSIIGTRRYRGRRPHKAPPTDDEMPTIGGQDVDIIKENDS